MKSILKGLATLVVFFVVIVGLFVSLETVPDTGL